MADIRPESKGMLRVVTLGAALAVACGEASAADGDCYGVKYGDRSKSHWTLTVSGRGLIWSLADERIFLDVIEADSGWGEAIEPDGTRHWYSNPADRILVLDHVVYELGCANDGDGNSPPGAGTPGPDSKGTSLPVG